MAVGKSAPMLDAREKVTGQITYAAALEVPGMLVGKAFRSPAPHARILNLDVRAAEQIPGVVAIVTAADFEGPHRPHLYFGSTIQDQPIVAGDKIRYLGEPVALVAAETAASAQAALEAIDLEIEELPAVFDAQEAMRNGAPVLHEANADNCFRHAKLRHGDLKEGFALADLVIEETFTSPIAQQVTLEPQAAVAQWTKDGLTVWTGTQSPYTVRRVLAQIFELDPEDVRVVVPPLGGGFGGKGNIRTQPLAAALAWKVNGRPVKLVNTRAEEFLTVTKHAAKIQIKSGVTKDGALTARKISIYWNGGAYASSSAHLVPAGLLRAIGPYRIPAVEVDSYGVYTNLPVAAAYRGAMSSQGVFAHEAHMDTIARAIGLDPVAVWKRNLLVDGDTFATGETMHEARFIECLDSVLEGIQWDSNFDHGDGMPLRRGRGFGVMMKNTIANSGSECRLALSSDGKLMLFTSTVEMGQGAHTALAQIAAGALGLDVEAVRVQGPDTALTPPDAQTASSRSTHMMGNAILDAAARLKDQLLRAAEPLLEHPAEELAYEAGTVFARETPAERISFQEILGRSGLPVLEAHGRYATDVDGLDPETGQGIATPAWHQGAGVCIVEIDTETGKVTVPHYYSAAFAGTVVNPALASLQNDGNVIYGLGATLFEEMIFDDGQLVNANLSDYMIPSFLDIPARLENMSLEEAGSTFHGIGEMTLPPVAPAIANAINDALGIKIRDLPITPERVLRALRAKAGENESA